MKLLITGSSGHLGEALMRSLRGQYELRGIDLLPSPFTDRVGSIVDPEFVRESMQGIDAVLHTATLHKPHVVTHSKQAFIDTNITGTLNLLEAAVAANVKAFLFTSTTSVFGDAMRPGKGAPTVWVSEALSPRPKNIYGLTKIAAENLCRLFARNHKLPCLVLRTSRFFREADDNPATRDAYVDPNIKANEFLYRRVDLEDIVSAHQLALDKAPELGFGTFIISATPPFRPEQCPALRQDAAQVVQALFPACAELFAQQGWRLYPSLDRVYDNARARELLGWQPRYDFQHVLDCLAAGRDFHSPLAGEVGIKPYHEETFEEGPYPV